jgi:hypothetical protein
MVGDIAWPRAPIALAGLLDKLRGGDLDGDLDTVGSDLPDGEAGPRPERAWPVSRGGRFMDWASIRHVLLVLLAPIVGECPVLRLLCSYMARGTAMNKCAWSCWPSRSPRTGSGSQSGLAE